jgi:multiple sugar transport system substrate-binding protein
MRKKHVAFTVVLIMLASLLAACNGSVQQKEAEGNTNQPVGVTKEPVTLKFLQYKSALSDDEFNTLIAEPVKVKYPNITLELERLQPKDTLETRITSGSTPDITYAGILNVLDLQEVKLAVDLNPFIKKFNHDLSSYQPATLDMVKKYSDDGELLALPFSLVFPIMMYNKDIFDRFAVPYPKDDMTWDETTDLARKLTRQEGGIQYNGFGTLAMGRLSMTMLQPRFDPKAGKAVLQTEGFKEVFQIYKAMADATGDISTNPTKRFSVDRTLAMYADYNQSMTGLEEMHKAGNPFNWDIVTFPSMPNKKLTVDTPLNVLFVTSKDAKLQEAAFHVISFLNSKEQQLRLSKAGRPSVLNDSDIKKAFGQDLPSLQGKNIQAGFKYKNEPLNRKYKYDDIITTELNKAATAVIKGDKDINTSIREAEEAANKTIGTLK